MNDIVQWIVIYFDWKKTQMMSPLKIWNCYIWAQILTILESIIVLGAMIIYGTIYLETSWWITLILCTLFLAYFLLEFVGIHRKMYGIIVFCGTMRLLSILATVIQLGIILACDLHLVIPSKSSPCAIYYLLLYGKK